MDCLLPCLLRFKIIFLLGNTILLKQTRIPCYFEVQLSRIKTFKGYISLLHSVGFYGLCLLVGMINFELSVHLLEIVIH